MADTKQPDSMNSDNQTMRHEQAKGSVSGSDRNEMGKSQSEQSKGSEQNEKGIIGQKERGEKSDSGSEMNKERSHSETTGQR